MQSASSFNRLCASAVREASLKSNRTASQLHFSEVAFSAQVPPWHSCPLGQSSLVLQAPATHLLERHLEPAAQSLSCSDSWETHLPASHFLPPQSASWLHSGFGTQRWAWHTKPGLQFWSVAHSWHCPSTQTSLWSLH